MFICSMRMSKKKMLAIVLFVLVLVAGIVCFITFKGMPSEVREPKGQELTVKSQEDIVSYVESFGWEIDVKPSEIVEVTVPEVFNEVYENYNVLQKKQGFDLELYKGKLVTRTTFVVHNYPDYPDNIRADVLTCEKKIIGGDICSIEISGFMKAMNGE